MKSLCLIFSFLLSISAFAQVTVSSKSDDKFGGYYLEIAESQKDLSVEWKKNVEIKDVLIIQKLMRDCLLDKSKSFFRFQQTPFLIPCAQAATEKVKNYPNPGFKKENGLTVVFDMDETLLTQWHLISKEHPERTTLIVKHLDSTLSEKDKIQYIAPTGVTIRPGSIKLLRTLTEYPKISKIFFFSAREDRSAEELRDYFLQNIPSLKNKFKGLFARNSLRLDSTTSTPSKDLRIISPNLENIILIDDNPGRVIQKELNFSIPKFNADMFLIATEKYDKDILEANYAVMPFVYQLITSIADSSNVQRDFYSYSTKYAESHGIDWGLEILKLTGFTPFKARDLIQNKIFLQEWVPGKIIK